MDLGLDKVSLYKLQDGCFKEEANLNIAPGSGASIWNFIQMETFLICLMN
nr:hypothetical protein [Clostridium sp. C2-6-12]